MVSSSFYNHHANEQLTWDGEEPYRLDGLVALVTWSNTEITSRTERKVQRLEWAANHSNNEEERKKDLMEGH